MKVSKNEFAKVPECLRNVKFERMLINVYKINSKIEVQRDVDMKRAKYMAENWIENFNHDPIISINSETKEFDQPSGQHTVAAYIMRLENGLENNATIWCRVAKDLTKEQLNAIFAYEAIASKPQSARSVIEALWNSGDPCLHNTDKIINKFGYTLPCNKNGNMIVNCVQHLIDMDSKDLNRCFDLISNVFPKDIKKNRQIVNNKAVEATFIKSVRLFLDVWGSNEDYDIKKMRSAIINSDTNAKQILLDSKRIEQYNKYPTRQLAYMLAKTYNDRSRKVKLKLSKLDDYFTSLN